ncbi:hypothetical protein HUJ04_008953 [Dendroctonus ponderosae]|nr:hypothetical protein HUJ04_008953 [Dendroctonus ponderosae]KAH1008938.1 hypothetical protein HUJ05_009429 [Dendroctonus ponderosae]
METVECREETSEVSQSDEGGEFSKYFFVLLLSGRFSKIIIITFDYLKTIRPASLITTRNPTWMEIQSNTRPVWMISDGRMVEHPPDAPNR